MCYISCPFYILCKYLTCFTKWNSLPRNSNTFEMKGAFQCYLTNILQHYRSLFCKHFYSAYGRGRIKIIKTKIKKTTPPPTHKNPTSTTHTTTKHQTGKEKGIQITSSDFKTQHSICTQCSCFSFFPSSNKEAGNKETEEADKPLTYLIYGPSMNFSEINLNSSSCI